MAGAAQALTATEQYRKAMEQAEGIRMAALDEMRGQLNEQIAQLNSFGYDYRLTRASGKGAGKVTRATQAPAMQTKPAYCAICDMQGHDGRMHRSQGRAKKKFTKAELEERGVAI